MFWIFHSCGLWLFVLCVLVNRHLNFTAECLAVSSEGSVQTVLWGWSCFQVHCMP